MIARMANGCDCTGALKSVFTALGLTGCGPFIWRLLDTPTPRVVMWNERYHSFRVDYQEYSTTDGIPNFPELNGSMYLTEDVMTGVLSGQFTGTGLGPTLAIASRVPSNPSAPPWIVDGVKVGFTDRVPTWANPARVDDSYDYRTDGPDGAYSLSQGRRMVSPTAITFETYLESYGNSFHPELGTGIHLNKRMVKFEMTLGNPYSLTDMHNEYLALNASDICNLDLLAYSKKFSGKTRYVHRLRDGTSTLGYPTGMTASEQAFFVAASFRQQLGPMPVFAIEQKDFFFDNPKATVQFPARAVMAGFTQDTLPGRYVYRDVEADVTWQTLGLGNTVAYEQNPWAGWVTFVDGQKAGIKSRVRETDRRHFRNYCLATSRAGQYDTNGEGYTVNTIEGFSLKGPMERTFIPEAMPINLGVGDPRQRSFTQGLQRDTSPVSGVCTWETVTPC